MEHLSLRDVLSCIAMRRLSRDFGSSAVGINTAARAFVSYFSVLSLIGSFRVSLPEYT